MPFKIKNVRPTFLTIELSSQPVTINARGEAGPFDDAEKSPGLAMAERRDDVAIIEIPQSPAPAQKAAKTIKEDNPS